MSNLLSKAARFGALITIAVIAVPLLYGQGRFGLVTTTEKRDDGESQNYRCDIRFRMLRPRELAAAMGFEQYEFTGNREQQVKQIGNAVSVRTARALCLAILPRFLKRGCFNGEELVA
jgi:site-specific DNA-cytosine methylase